MPEPLFEHAVDLRSILDAMPSMVFIMDGELRILDANRAAARTLGDKPELLLKRLCGDVLHCIHARETIEGCGTTAFCPDCVIRQSAESTRQGKTFSRKRHRMRVWSGDGERDAFFLVSASSLRYNDVPLAVIVLDDISEMMELRRIVPICARCKKVRDDAEFWHHVEGYMKKYMEVDFSHALCPTCLETLYQESE